ncbi:MAG: hypothetical protein U9N43_06725 [Euryarchaeota archaeon]|nr:hypothetical protein [Euryarchaeota archaeon]
MTKKAFMLVTIAFLTIVMHVQFASALGLGAFPDRIDYGILMTGDGSAKSLYVINTGDEVEQIVVATEAFGNITKLSASEFTLNPEESRLINVTMAIPSDFEAGDHSGSILITSFPGASTGLGIGESVRVPLEFSVEKKPVPLMVSGIAIIGCVCLMITLFVCASRLR